MAWSTTGTAVSDAARIALMASITLVPPATANTVSFTAPSSRTVRDSTSLSSAPCALRNLATSIWVSIRYPGADSTSSTATTLSAELSSGTSARCTPLLNVSMQSSTLAERTYRVVRCIQCEGEEKKRVNWRSGRRTWLSDGASRE